jgi:DNA-binding transcriptional LysR family regulator
MDSLTLDQFTVFMAIVEGGSFAAAARKLGRAQSAITYSVQKLEDQSGAKLFDRSEYRPHLTDAGRLLLPRIKRIVADVADYRQQLTEMAAGVEAELAVVVDAMAPMNGVVKALKELHGAFPAVHIILSVRSIEEAASAVSTGEADIGVLPDVVARQFSLERNLCGTIELVAVAAPDHPLGRIDAIIEPSMLAGHLQLVLTNRTPTRDSHEYGVHSVNLWHVADLETKHHLLSAGLGWGSMPRHRVEADLSSGRLVELKLAQWEGADQMPNFAYVVAHRADKTLGAVGRRLVEEIVKAGTERCQQQAKRTPN